MTIEQQIGAQNRKAALVTPAELKALLKAPRKPRKKRNAQPERELCKSFIRTMRFYPHVYVTHIPNELPRPDKAEKEFYERAGRHLKEMGRIAGTPDYLIEWKGGYGFLEAKAQGRGLSTFQQAFFDARAKRGVPCGLFTSIDEALAILKTWGAV